MATGLAVGLAAPRRVAAADTRLLMPWTGPVVVTRVSSETTCDDGDLSLSSPFSQLVFANYGTTAPPPVDLGVVNAGQELVFALTPRTGGAVCQAGSFLSTDPTHAWVTALEDGGWRIE